MLRYKIISSLSEWKAAQEIWVEDGVRMTSGGIYHICPNSSVFRPSSCQCELQGGISGSVASVGLAPDALSSRAVLANRNKMGVAHTLQNFLVATLKRQKDTSEVNFNNVLFKPVCPNYHSFNM